MCKRCPLSPVFCVFNLKPFCCSQSHYSQCCSCISVAVSLTQPSAKMQVPPSIGKSVVALLWSMERDARLLEGDSREPGALLVSRNSVTASRISKGLFVDCCGEYPYYTGQVSKHTCVCFRKSERIYSFFLLLSYITFSQLFTIHA